MRIGLALPQYDYSVAGERRCGSRRSSSTRALAERGRRRVGLALRPPVPRSREVRRIRPSARPASIRSSRSPRSPALVPRVRLGTLVLLEALRPASVLAKALATLDCVSGGRLDVGLGAGWYEPEYEALGMEMPRPGVRLDRLVDALEVVNGLLGGGPFTYDGRAPPRVRRDATGPCAVAAAAAARVRRRQGRPAARGSRREHADGWNTCWVWTPDAYRERLRRARRRVRERAAAIRRRCGARSGSTRCAARTSAISSVASTGCASCRRPACSTASISRRSAPGGSSARSTRCASRCGEWEALGVDTLILGVGRGAVPGVGARRRRAAARTPAPSA